MKQQRSAVRRRRVTRTPESSTKRQRVAKRLLERVARRKLGTRAYVTDGRDGSCTAVIIMKGGCGMLSAYGDDREVLLWCLEQMPDLAGADPGKTPVQP